MRFRPVRLLVLAASAGALSLSACDRGGGGTPSIDATMTADDEPTTDPNRVAIPATVRSNLGIGFIRVERRRVERTLRVPGRFEYRPDAHREYRTMLPGRVELLVEQFDRISAGTPLFRVDSTAWREIQRDLADRLASIDRFETRLAVYEPLLAAHDRHARSLEDTVDVWSDRVAQLQAVRDAGGGRSSEFADARAALAAARSELASVAEKQAEIEAARTQARADLAAARTAAEFSIRSAASLVGRAPQDLQALVSTDDGVLPAWRVIESITVHADAEGVVESIDLTDGSWADERSTVLRVVRPERIRFRATALQSDLGALRDGLPARIVPPTPTTVGDSVPLTASMAGALTLGLDADPDDRTIDLHVTPETLLPWARAGVSALLEIVTDATVNAELAIPLAAVQRDGLTPVIFRRDPRDPNEAIRIEADLGKDDGRWVALLSGVREGDEIVLDGAFQLMLATSGSIQKGGHFHADGTFHEGEH